jgi:hypothetical protein
MLHLQDASQGCPMQKRNLQSITLVQSNMTNTNKPIDTCVGRTS